MEKRDRLRMLYIMLISMLIGMIVATQKLASLVQYHALLGSPLFHVEETPIYFPCFFYWWVKYGKEVPEAFSRCLVYFTIPVVVGVIACGIYKKLIAKENLTAYGSARWATKKENQKSNLLDGKGVFLGKNDDGEYLRHDGPHHILTIAPTRSGKGVGLIIPTLLTWPHSTVVTDIKGENWALTAGYRKEKLNNKVLKFEPTAFTGSAHYNPLDEVRIKTPNEIRDIQNIVNIIVDPQGKGELDHFQKNGATLLVGVILHLKYIYHKTDTNVSFALVNKFMSDPEKALIDSFEDMKHATHDPDKKFIREIYGVDSQTHPIVAQTAQEMSQKPEEELGSIISTAVSFLAIYRDPVLAKNTTGSDFFIEDLMNHEQPVSLYLIVPPSDIDRMNPVFRMIVELIYRRSTEKMEFKGGEALKHYKHRMLLLLDEFPGLGRLDAFEKALAYIAGYGIKALLITQGLNQLNKIYTENNSIIDNCHIRVVHTPNDNTTPKYISEMLGKTTIEVKTRSYSGMPIFGENSHSMQQIARDLMTPEEVSSMDPEKEIIFVTGFAPSLVSKIRYYNDKNFTARKREAPESSETIRQAQ
jgi:type IV secretion system protein VirD4